MNMFERRNEPIEDAEIVPTFSGVKSFAEMKTRLDTEVVVGSDGQPFTSTEFDTAIIRARESRFAVLNRFTRSGGMREQVAKLFIAEAEDLAELSQLLKHIPSIENDDGVVYEQSTLLAAIQQYLDGEVPLEKITRSYSLRDTVAKIKSHL